MHTRCAHDVGTLGDVGNILIDRIKLVGGQVLQGF
jgi:hypothetical protein